jgi:hypothetical protein
VSDNKITCSVCTAIPNCLTCSNSLCSSCAINYGIMYTVDKKLTSCRLCNEMIDNCETCYNESLCLSCS